MKETMESRKDATVKEINWPVFESTVRKVHK